MLTSHDDIMIMTLEILFCFGWVHTQRIEVGRDAKVQNMRHR